MGLKILVAEDNRFTAQQYQRVLEKNGHKVEVVYDGDECVEKYVSKLGNSEFDSIEKHPYDLILLDHNMPKKTGIKVAEEILSKKPNQRIIFASGYMRSIIEDQTGEHITEKLEILEKPFSLSQLLRKIHSIENKEANH